MSEGGTVGRRRGYVIGDGLSGGFWRRVVAFWIDHALVGLVLSLIGAAAFHMTDGGVRYRSPVGGPAYCTPISPGSSANLERLAGPSSRDPRSLLRPARPPEQIRYALCSPIGLIEGDRYVQVALIWQGPINWFQITNHPLRPSGGVIYRTFDLGILFYPALLVWLAFSEAVWGGGPGKRILGLGVIHRDGLSSARFRATLARNALLYGPAAFFGLTGVVQMFSGTSPGGVPSGWPLILPGMGAGLWSLVLLVCALNQRPDPFWDRWSGVSVRRRVWIEDR